MDLNEKENGHVSFDDASKINVYGKRNILIQTKNDSHQLILNVYCVRDMKTNILSLGELLEKTTK